MKEEIEKGDIFTANSIPMFQPFKDYIVELENNKKRFWHDPIKFINDIKEKMENKINVITERHIFILVLSVFNPTIKILSNQSFKDKKIISSYHISCVTFI